VAATHTYQAAGTYTVRLRVTDARGAVSQPASTTASIGGYAPVTFVGAGDIANCGWNGDEETAELLDRISGVVYTLGDNVYGDGSLRNFNNCYHPSWGRHKERTRPSVGNHEYADPQAAGYFEYFGDAAGESGKGYYSYDLGAWHIIVLNSNCPQVGGCGFESPQMQWLRADLAANTRQCILAYWHHPLFTSGRAPATNMRIAYRTLYQAGAEIVLVSHEHHYERFAPQDHDGVADPDRGIRQFVVGTGGAPLYDFFTPHPNSEVRYNATHGVMKFVLSDGGYTWEFIPTSGPFTDVGAGSCH
jgi:acid phosphatase type 7